MAQDISRNTLFVLVTLTLLVSLLGTWTVLSNINSYAPPKASSPQSTGEMSLTIAPPTHDAGMPATGDVTFKITKGG